MLYAGPLPTSEVILPVGEFQLLAEVYDEANAYGVYVVITPLKLWNNTLGRFDVTNKYALA
jgi:hypothetical protein